MTENRINHRFCGAPTVRSEELDFVRSLGQDNAKHDKKSPFATDLVK